MSKHTAGPWKAAADENLRWPEQIGCCPLTGRPYSIAAGSRNVAAATTAADARLISAAPDLLKAIEIGYAETIDYITRNKLSAENNHWLRLARAAIAKANGEQS